MPAKSSNKPDDYELVAICNSGDAAAATRAFSLLYERHREYVLRIAMRYAHDPDIAAEALQETFTWLLRRFPPPGPGIELTAQLRTFLFPIARNAAISALRKMKRFESAVDDPDEPTVLRGGLVGDLDALGLLGEAGAARRGRRGGEQGDDPESGDRRGGQPAGHAAHGLTVPWRSGARMQA